MRIGYPLGNVERSVGDIGLSCGSPCITVSLYGCLLNRAQGSECCQRLEVRAGIGKLYNEGLSIGSGYCQSIQITGLCLVKALNHTQNSLSIRSCYYGIAYTLPAVYEIVCGQITAVRPL